MEVEGTGEQQFIDPRPTLILILDWTPGLAPNLLASEATLLRSHDEACYIFPAVDSEESLSRSFAVEAFLILLKFNNQYQDLFRHPMPEIFYLYQNHM